MGNGFSKWQDKLVVGARRGYFVVGCRCSGRIAASLQGSEIGGSELGGIAMRRAIVMLTVLAAAGVAASSGPVAAQGWNQNGPAFESDIKRQEEEEAAKRAERRKSYGPTVYPKFMQGGERPDIQPVEPPTVYFDRQEDPGSIIIDTQERKLFYVLPGKKAYQYPISVGRDGFTWSGTHKISRIASWPSWTPPPEMHKRVPGLPLTVTGGMKNPQGARALYLGNTVYRIHGTNNDRTVGRANSSGCFRLKNEHVVHLASIAKVGTKVKVLQAYAGSVSESAPLSSLFSFGFGDDEEPAANSAKGKSKKVVAKQRPSAPAKKSALKQTIEPKPADTPTKKASAE